MSLDDGEKQSEVESMSGTLTSHGTEELDGRNKSVTYADEKKLHLRMRRTKSVARAEEITKEAEKVRKSQPDKP